MAKHTIVVGAQQGDEGKARVIDQLVNTGEFKHIVRFNGSCNAGHTVYIEGRKFVTHSVPCGILHEDTMNYIGAGCLINPLKLVQEIQDLEEFGIKNVKARLRIDYSVNFILPEHIERDLAAELVSPVGSTKQGVAPAYSDKYARKGVNFLNYKDKNLSQEIRDALYLIQHCFTNVGEELRYVSETENILFEGAQGTALDVDSYDYPNVTSSHCTAPYAMIGSGIGMLHSPNVIGVIKPYLTKVGTGHFPSSIEGTPEAEAIRAAGKEFGATTGRKRMIGHINMTELKHAVSINGVTELALLKNDIIPEAGLEYVGVYYEDNGITFPGTKPFKAWKSIDDKEFQIFKSFLESELGVKVKYLGFGTDRSQFKVLE